MLCSWLCVFNVLNLNWLCLLFWFWFVIVDRELFFGGIGYQVSLIASLDNTVEYIILNIEAFLPSHPPFFGCSRAHVYLVPIKHYMK